MKYFVVFSIILSSMEMGFFCETAKFTPVDAVIFDIDGLLLNTEELYFNSHSEICRRFNKTYTKSLQLQFMGRNTSMKIVVDTLSLNTTPEAYQAEYDKLKIQRLHSVAFMPGAEKLVRHLSLHRIPIAIATSNNQYFFNFISDHHKNIFSLFSHIVAGDGDPEVKRGKPAPDIFLICMKRFQEQLTPEKVLVLEDSPIGVLGARRAGMQVVMVPDSNLPQHYQVNATKVITTLLDFKPEDFGLPSYS